MNMKIKVLDSNTVQVIYKNRVFYCCFDGTYNHFFYIPTPKYITGSFLEYIQNLINKGK